MVPQPLWQCCDTIINNRTDAQKADVNFLILPQYQRQRKCFFFFRVQAEKGTAWRIDVSSKLTNKIARSIAIVAKTKFDATASKLIRTFHYFGKLFRRDVIWIQCFHWPNITTCISLCLCYAWAVFHYQLFQRKRKHERKHKKKENIWSFCLRLHLCLCQDSFHDEIRLACAFACVANGNQV